jgi:hypothetical protein
MAALSVGTLVIQLRRIARRLDPGSALAAALDALRGDIAAATARFTRLDETLAARPSAATFRARGSILALSGVLAQPAAYFDSGAPR